MVLPRKTRDVISAAAGDLNAAVVTIGLIAVGALILAAVALARSGRPPGP